MLNIIIGTLIITFVAFIHIYATLNEGSTIDKMMHYAVEELNKQYILAFIWVVSIALFLIVIGLRGM